MVSVTAESQQNPTRRFHALDNVM